MLEPAVPAAVAGRLDEIRDRQRQLRPVGRVTGVREVSPMSVREGQDAADLWAVFCAVVEGRDGAAAAVLDGMDADHVSVLQAAGETVVRLAQARLRGVR